MPGTVAGVDIAEQRKGLDLVVIDPRRRIVASEGKLTLADVTAAVMDIRPEMVCIDGPPRWAAVGRSRAAERELLALGIHAFAVPVDPGDHLFYRWMRVGFTVYEKLAPSYPLRTCFPITGGAVEVFPHASACVLAQRRPDRAESKLAFRTGVLEAQGVDTSACPTIDRIDAALAALTGVLALAGQGSFVGDPCEGCILVPVVSLPASLHRPRSRTAASGGLELSERLCECGCGARVRRRFLPGHDAKLKSVLLSQHRAGDGAATDRLNALGWLR